ncbi:carbohydrate sulfotransferase 14-like [Mercenaria mercenaria]|uniref:carbohydrate sulfotransferase 14-like n=1 Tax=Mercenaria mercenaria TaxID=6596 RepID=UPI00234E8887|nr:carbohydrate sulfotransferase 14-like [Mercenaria mercenaria]
MRRRKLMILYFAVVTLKLLLGTKSKSTDDLKRETWTGTTIKNEMSSKSNSNDAVETNARRMKSLEKACRNLGYTDDNYTIAIRAHMSPDYKCLYCRVNKCASTTTLEIMRQIFNCDTDCLVKMASIVRSNVNASKIMKDAFSFMVVREPYGRLFSTYCNIFYFPKEDWIYRGTKIIKLSRSNISSDSLNFGHDLTFSELIKYIVESFENGLRLDEHVRPMHHKSCNPCLFHFDYIAHLETLNKDFEYILKTMYNRKIIQNYPGDIVSSLREWTLYGPVKHLFRTILLVKGSSISQYSIFLRAWSYYQITGQISKTIAFPYSKDNFKLITKDEFIRALKTAIESSRREGNDLNKQRHEAMLQAYSTVSPEYMERLRKVVATDCFLFGYQERLDFIFNRSKLSSNKDFNTFNFFKGL